MAELDWKDRIHIWNWPWSDWLHYNFLIIPLQWYIEYEDFDMAAHSEKNVSFRQNIYFLKFFRNSGLIGNNFFGFPFNMKQANFRSRSNRKQRTKKCFLLRESYFSFFYFILIIF